VVSIVGLVDDLLNITSGKKSTDNHLNSREGKGLIPGGGGEEGEGSLLYPNQLCGYFTSDTSDGLRIKCQLLQPE
jgi:hypothetical protein